MRRTPAKSLTAIVLILLAGIAAATTNGDWSAGKSAFRNGDYEIAIEHFGRALDAGLQGPAVHYNIGVSQYRLGRYEDADDTFAFIAARFPKMRALAEYNRGLALQRLGRDRQAMAHFLRAYELSPDDRKLRILASRALRDIDPAIRAASRWRGAIGARAGYDDNVVLRDESTVSPGQTTDSPMFDLFATIEGPWRSGGGLRLRADAYLVRYPDADLFDQSDIEIGAMYDWRPGDWRVVGGVHAGAGTLGGEDFDREIGGDLRLVRYLGQTAALELRYRYDDINDADSLFPGIEGSRQRVDARYRWYRDHHHVRLRYWYETNDRQDPGVSPDRSRFGVYYRYSPERGLGWEAGWDLRSSEYDATEIPREEDLTTLSAALTWMLPGNWLTVLEYRDAENDSTDDFFSYDRQQITLGVIRAF